MADSTVQLQVKSYTNNLPGGFQRSANTAAGYCYKYTGGNNTAKDGSFSFSKGSGQKSVGISLNASSGFVIASVSISYDNAQDPHDLTPPTSGVDGVWTITDSDVNAESGYYTVYVNDTDGTQNIECDPRWTNND
ncbi:MAG: hypothetical protein V7742_19915 [Halioglobus sp.]